MRKLSLATVALVLVLTAPASAQFKAGLGYGKASSGGGGAATSIDAAGGTAVTGGVGTGPLLYEDTNHKAAESANLTFDGTNLAVGGTVSLVGNETTGPSLKWSNASSTSGLNFGADGYGTIWSQGLVIVDFQGPPGAGTGFTNFDVYDSIGNKIALNNYGSTAGGGRASSQEIDADEDLYIATGANEPGSRRWLFAAADPGNFLAATDGGPDIGASGANRPNNIFAKTLISTAGTITDTNTGSIGWSVVAGANTACNTTCTNACVVGFNIAAAVVTAPVSCTDATADVCICAGAS